jgi:hypothetical protein
LQKYFFEFEMFIYEIAHKIKLPKMIVEKRKITAN